jgi:hypothetical protein
LKQAVGFRVFSIVAALAERVTALDGKLRQNINRLQLNGLEAKLASAKQLFYINDPTRRVRATWVTAVLPWQLTFFPLCCDGAGRAPSAWMPWTSSCGRATLRTQTEKR